MKRHLRRLVPSPAMVVALHRAVPRARRVRLRAWSITGKTIKNNTVTGKDIRNGTLRAKDVKPGLARRRLDQGVQPRHGAVSRDPFGAARFAVVTGGGSSLAAAACAPWRAPPPAATR